MFTKKYILTSALIFILSMFMSVATSAYFDVNNFAQSELFLGISSNATSLTVSPNDGVAKFPTRGLPFRAIIFGRVYGSPQDDPNREIVTATWSSGDTFLIIRGREQTAPHTWYPGDHFVNTITRDVINEVQTFIPVIAPSDPTSTCIVNQFAFDTSYFYVCVGTNSWKRVPLCDH